MVLLVQKTKLWTFLKENIVKYLIMIAMSKQKKKKKMQKPNHQIDIMFKLIKQQKKENKKKQTS